MNTELMEALEVLEKEKNISKDTLLEAIEQSLIQGTKKAPLHGTFYLVWVRRFELPAS